jgi:hypothetical protein
MDMAIGAADRDTIAVAAVHMVMIADTVEGAKATGVDNRVAVVEEVDMAVVAIVNKTTDTIRIIRMDTTRTATTKMVAASTMDNREDKADRTTMAATVSIAGDK